METDGGAGHPIGVNIKANPEVKKNVRTGREHFAGIWSGHTRFS